MLLSIRHDANFKLNPCPAAIQPIWFCCHWCCFGCLWKHSRSSMLEALFTWSHLILTAMLWGRLLSPFYKGRSRNSDSSKVSQLTNGRNWVQPYTLSAPSHRVPALPPALKLQMGFSPSARWKLEVRAWGEGWATGLLCRGLKPFGLLPTNSFPFLSCWWKAWYYRWLCFIRTHTHTHTHSKESAHCI